MTAAPLPRALPAIAVTAVGAALAWGLRHQGGYRRWQFEPFIGLLLVGVVVGIFATRPWLGPRRLLVAAVFLTPMLASALWNGPVAVRGCSGPLALALGVLGALHLGGQIEGRTRHVLVGLVLGSGVIVAGTSWWGVAFRRYRWALEADGLWRGSSVLTYANSTAALLVALALAVAAIVAGTRAATVRGSAWRLLLFVLLVGAGATQSRAAALAGIVGAAVLASLQRRQLCRAVPTVLAAVVATAGVIASSPVAAERRPTLALATLALGAALVVIPAWLAIPVRGCWDPRVRSTSAVLFGLLATAAIVIGASQLLPEAFLQSRVSAASPQSGATRALQVLLPAP